ncbi:MAG: hypothetical protein ACYC9O_13200 [Candidatus Latescibacterota bacterium]
MDANTPKLERTHHIADLIDLTRFERENRRRLSRCFVFAAGALALLTVFCPPLLREVHTGQERPYRTIVTDLIELPARSYSEPFLLRRAASARQSLVRPGRRPGLPAIAGRMKSPAAPSMGADTGAFDIDLNALPG